MIAAETRTPLDPRWSVLLHLAMLGVGVAGLWVSQRIATVDPAVGSASLWTSLVSIASLSALARGVYITVSSGSSEFFRVFRSRHLVLVGLILLAASVVLTMLVVLDDPFGRFFAHGRITSSDLADLAGALGAMVCGLGAIVSFTGAWEAHQAERRWYDWLHLHGRRH